VSFNTTLARWHWHTHTGTANGNKCADVGAALQQVDSNTGGDEVGLVNSETLSTENEKTQYEHRIDEIN